MSGVAVTLEQAVEAVERAIRASAMHIRWPQPGVLEAIKEQETARSALATLPSLNVASYPYYPSVDDDQSGCVIAAHLSEAELASVPAHLVNEILDALTDNAAGVSVTATIEHKRNQLLAAYGAELAELVVKAVHEGLRDRSEGHRRLREYDGSKIAPLHSTDLDEPYYETVGSDAEHACPVTTFDFYDAISAARELIEQRDEAAAAARRGENSPTVGSNSLSADEPGRRASIETPGASSNLSEGC